MDDPVLEPRREPRSRFGPDPRLTALSGVLTLAAAAAAFVATTGPATLLFALAAAVLAGYTAADLLWPVRLEVDAAGLAVRSPWLGPRTTRLRWDQLDAVREDVRNRHGLRSAALELESGDELIVLSRRALGTDPSRVAELIAAYRPR